MRELKPPFRFDLRQLLGSARRKVAGRVEGVTISLPFVSLAVQAVDLERQIAREVVLRLADRRVLNAFECCDGCIRDALTSLQEIRGILLDRRIELAKLDNSPLALLLEVMLESIRQFLTFEQRLEHYGLPLEGGLAEHELRGPPPRRLQSSQQAYFAGLEMLRAHLHRCLNQVAAMAGMQIPKIPAHMRYNEQWQLEAYVPLS